MSGTSYHFCHVICTDPFLYFTKDLSALESVKAEEILSYWKHKSLLGLFSFMLSSHTIENPTKNHFYGTNAYKILIENLHNFGVFSNFSFPSCVVY